MFWRLKKKEENISDNLRGFDILLVINLDLPFRHIVAAEFYKAITTLVLQHEDGQKNVANLEVEDDCIFRGHCPCHRMQRKFEKSRV